MQGFSTKLTNYQFKGGKPKWPNRTQVSPSKQRPNSNLTKNLNSNSVNTQLINNMISQSNAANPHPQNVERRESIW